MSRPPTEDDRAVEAPAAESEPAPAEAPASGEEAAREAGRDSHRGPDPAREATPPAGEDTPAGPEPAGGEGADDAVASLERERDQYLELARRTQADFENYRKRAAREAAAAGLRARAELVREVLPAVDNLERALANAGEGEQALAEGVRLVHTELLGALRRSGVETIEPAGEPFDPTVHEALSTRAEDGAKPGVVLEVVQKGYRTAEKVIRPARVVVSA